jgi:hypothetical protein
MRIARTSPLKKIQSIKSYCKRRFSPVRDVTGPMGHGGRIPSRLNIKVSLKAAVIVVVWVKS